VQYPNGEENNNNNNNNNNNKKFNEGCRISNKENKKKHNKTQTKEEISNKP
jgi:hypothetical protein